jgi:hypothetical protein
MNEDTLALHGAELITKNYGPRYNLVELPGKLTNASLP